MQNAQINCVQLQNLSTFEDLTVGMPAPYTEYIALNFFCYFVSFCYLLSNDVTLGQFSVSIFALFEC